MTIYTCPTAQMPVKGQFVNILQHESLQHPGVPVHMQDQLKPGWCQLSHSAFLPTQPGDSLQDQSGGWASIDYPPRSESPRGCPQKDGQKLPIPLPQICMCMAPGLGWSSQYFLLLIYRVNDQSLVMKAQIPDASQFLDHAQSMVPSQWIYKATVQSRKDQTMLI